MTAESVDCKKTNGAGAMQLHTAWIIFACGIATLATKPGTRNPGRQLHFTSSLFLMIMSFATPGYADTLTPKHLQYEVEMHEDARAKTCNIMLELINFPSPETVNFRLILAENKKGKNAFVGFSIDVGDMIYKNGLPASLQKVPISHGSFDSADFSSSGRLNGGAVPDGGVMESTTDSETAQTFIASFLSGKFSISFSRSGSAAIRTYRITTAPPKDVQAKFFECADTFH